MAARGSSRAVRFQSITAPLLSGPTFIVEVAELVEAALQLVGATALFVGNAAARHKPAPAEVGRGSLTHAGREDRTESARWRRLHNSDTGIDLAGGAFAFDFAALVFAAKLK